MTRPAITFANNCGWLFGLIGLGTLLARPHVSESLALTTPIAAGLSWYIATCFAGFEIGKLTHDVEMRAFFLSSGYSIAFMYGVMAIESISSISLLTRSLGRQQPQHCV